MLNGPQYTIFEASKQIMKYSKLLLNLYFLFLISCGILRSSTPEPEVRNLLINLTSSYLTAVAQGNIQKISQMVYWDEFLGSGGSHMSNEDFLKQLQSVKNTWRPQEVPFLGLEVTQIKAYENDAEVFLKKKSPDPRYPSEFWVKFIWVGNSWVIKEDSLFGKNKFLAEVIKN